MKTATVKLFRAIPPWIKRVVIGQVSVGGFVEIARAAANKTAELKVATVADITGEQIIRSLREPEFCLFADCVTVGARPGYFSSWMSLRNFRAIMDASALTNDWPRLMAILNFDGKTPHKRGGIMSDLQAIARMFPGLDPMTIMREWAMEDFLSFCDSLNLQATSEDPTEDPDVRPLSLSALTMVPGVEVVH